MVKILLISFDIILSFLSRCAPLFLTCLTKKINFIYANRRESEPICNESVALSSYDSYTKRCYRGPTQGYYLKTTGKVNQISTNQWHFPAENIDSTAIFAVFPGKVNQIPTNSGHFPPEVNL